MMQNGVQDQHHMVNAEPPSDGNQEVEGRSSLQSQQRQRCRGRLQHLARRI
jgi:hypothetical protein